MSWHFSQALAAAYLGASSSDGEPSAPSNATPPQGGCLPQGKTTDALNPSPFGTMFEPSTATNGAALLTWFLAASRVRTLAQPGKAPDSTASEADSGLKCLGSLAKFDPDTRLWKTRQFSLLGGLESFSETWPRWGMMRAGECWELVPPELLTSGNESGFWRSPAAQEPGVSWERLETRTGEPVGSMCRHYDKFTGRMAQIGLIQQVQARLWPTPITTALADAVALWPTPTVCGNNNRKGLTKKSGDGLATAVKRFPTPTANEDSYRLEGNSQQSNCLGAMARRQALAAPPCSGGQLNPTWVEWLMAWPLGWTDSAASATDKFRQWLESHGEP